jgi:hypothetical protein
MGSHTEYILRILFCFGSASFWGLVFKHLSQYDIDFYGATGFVFGGVSGYMAFVVWIGILKKLEIIKG